LNKERSSFKSNAIKQKKTYDVDRRVTRFNKLLILTHSHFRASLLRTRFRGIKFNKCWLEWAAYVAFHPPLGKSEFERNKIYERLMSFLLLMVLSRGERKNGSQRASQRVCISLLWRHKNKLTHVMKCQKLIPFYNTIFHLMTSTNTARSLKKFESLYYYFYYYYYTHVRISVALLERSKQPPRIGNGKPKVSYVHEIKANLFNCLNLLCVYIQRE